MIKVLFVCLGNICRSPMAQFVFQNMVDTAGLAAKFEIDSAGTERYNEMLHAGIHHGTRKVLKQNKIPFTEHYARVIRKVDYNHFDYILTMEESNIEDIKDIIGQDPEHKIHLLLEYTKNPRKIRDPWYTGNFEETYQDVLIGCRSFLDWLTKEGKI